MRLSAILLPLALLAAPDVAVAQYYGTSPGYGGGYGGAVTPGYGTGLGYGTGIGYGAPGGYGSTGYGGVPSYGAGGAYGQYGYGQSGAYGAPYANPGVPQSGYVQNPTYPGSYQPRTPDDVMTPGRTRTDSATAGAPTVPLPGAAATALPAVQERRNPRGVRYEGLARVVDGNTILLGSEAIVLDGADAPELNQNCTDPGGLEWRCGRRSRDVLVRMVEGRRIVCTGVGFAGPQAITARCSYGTTDVNKAMVAEGWAMSPKATAPAYVADEAAAKADHRGVWAGTSVAPWTYRAKN